jgi:hypothetical protein
MHLLLLLPCNNRPAPTYAAASPALPTAVPLLLLRLRLLLLVAASQGSNQAVVADSAHATTALTSCT